jgi:hypothetical protein
MAMRPAWHPCGMDDTDVAELRQRLTEVEERLDRVAARFTYGYGSDSDREGWLLWIRQLTARRGELRRALVDREGRTARRTEDAAAR